MFHSSYSLQKKKLFTSYAFASAFYMEALWIWINLSNCSNFHSFLCVFCIFFYTEKKKFNELTIIIKGTLFQYICSEVKWGAPKKISMKSFEKVLFFSLWRIFQTWVLFMMLFEFSITIYVDVARFQIVKSYEREIRVRIVVSCVCWTCFGKNLSWKVLRCWGGD